MENIIKINDQLAVQGQFTPEQLQPLKDAGFKSVLNLRSSDEEGFLHDEQRLAEVAKLEYLNIPVNPAKIDSELILQLIQDIDQLEKPTLIHCKSGMRAGLMALLYIASRQKLSADQALEMGKELGFNFEANPKFRQIIESFLSDFQT